MDITAEGRPTIDVQEHQENEKLARVEPPHSPPNCAICLCTCANRCFTDCCLHQFCFNCLLEWSKIKAECPLCKQPFKSIIYNIKSNSEYEEHVIPNPEEVVENEFMELNEAYSNLPTVRIPNTGPRLERHFQFRYSNTNVRSISFRRSIYSGDWWAMPELTGRYRECSPMFFRENPAQYHRILPWLNRELAALIQDVGGIQIVQQRIMDLLPQKHILSNSYKRIVWPYLSTSMTNHFIHEFYHFATSTFDMIDYDTHVRYRRQPATLLPTYHETSSSATDYDSDVRVVDSPNDCILVPPPPTEVIVIHSDNSDSDVIYQAPTPPPVVVVSDSEDEHANDTNTSNKLLPIKLRFKLKKKSSKQKSLKRKRHSSESKNSDSSVSKSADSSEPQYCISATTSKDYNSSSSCTSLPVSSSESENEWTPVKSEYSHYRASRRKQITKETESRYLFRKKHELKRSNRKSKKHVKFSSSDSDFSPVRNNKVRKSFKNRTKYKKSKRHSNEKYKKSRKRSKESQTSNKIKLDGSDENIKTKSDNSDVYNKIKSDDSDEKNKIMSDDSYDKSLVVQDEDSSKSINVVDTNETIKEKLPISIPLWSLPAEVTNSIPDNNEPGENYNPNVAGPSSGYSCPSVIVKGNNMWFRRPDVEDINLSNSD